MRANETNRQQRSLQSIAFPHNTADLDSTAGALGGMPSFTETRTFVSCTDVAAEERKSDTFTMTESHGEQGGVETSLCPECAPKLENETTLHLDPVHNDSLEMCEFDSMQIDSEPPIELASNDFPDVASPKVTSNIITDPIRTESNQSTYSSNSGTELLNPIDVGTGSLNAITQINTNLAFIKSDINNMYPNSPKKKRGRPPGSKNKSTEASNISPTKRQRTPSIPPPPQKVEPSTLMTQVNIPGRKKPLPLSALYTLDRTGRTILFKYISQNDIPTITLLLKHGASINISDNAGYTPLHEACVHGDTHSDLVLFLLRNGAHVNAVCLEGNSPLHDAVEQNSHILCTILLQYGASTSLINNAGESAIDIASPSLKAVIKEWNLKRLDDIPLPRIALKSPKEVEMHLTFGKDIEERYDGKTAVHVCCLKGYSETLDLLAQYGADLYATTNDGDTPAALCLRLDKHECLSVLLSYGVCVEGYVASEKKSAQYTCFRIGDLAQLRYMAQPPPSSGPCIVPIPAQKEREKVLSREERKLNAVLRSIESMEGGADAPLPFYYIPKVKEVEKMDAMQSNIKKGAKRMRRPKKGSGSSSISSTESAIKESTESTTKESTENAIKESTESTTKESSENAIKESTESTTKESSESTVMDHSEDVEKVQQSEKNPLEEAKIEEVSLQQKTDSRKKLEPRSIPVESKQTYNTKSFDFLEEAKNIKQSSLVTYEPIHSKTILNSTPIHVKTTSNSVAVYSEIIIHSKPMHTKKTNDEKPSNTQNNSNSSSDRTDITTHSKHVIKVEENEHEEIYDSSKRLKPIEKEITFEQSVTRPLFKKKSKKKNWLGISGYINSEKMVATFPKIILGQDTSPIYIVMTESKKYFIDLQFALFMNVTSGRAFTDTYPTLITKPCSSFQKTLLQDSIVSVTLLEMFLKRYGNGTEESCRWVKAIDTPNGRGLKMVDLDVGLLQHDTLRDMLEGWEELRFVEIELEGLKEGDKEEKDIVTPVVRNGRFVSKMKKLRP